MAVYSTRFSDRVAGATAGTTIDLKYSIVTKPRNDYTWEISLTKHQDFKYI